MPVISLFLGCLVALLALTIRSGLSTIFSFERELFLFAIHFPALRSTLQGAPSTDSFLFQTDSLHEQPSSPNLSYEKKKLEQAVRQAVRQSESNKKTQMPSKIENSRKRKPDRSLRALSCRSAGTCYTPS